jgi:hypothetical protein
MATIFRVKARRIAIILGSLHLSMVASLGVWLWSDLLSFGNTGPPNSLVNSCGTELSSTVILGRLIPLGGMDCAYGRFWCTQFFSSQE